MRDRPNAIAAKGESETLLSVKEVLHKNSKRVVFVEDKTRWDLNFIFIAAKAVI